MPTVSIMAFLAFHTIHIVPMRKMVREWIHTHPEVDFIHSQSKQCDMNPIENVCVMINECDIRQEYTSDVFVNHAQDPSICVNFVNSMPEILQRVSDAQGGWSK